ncbi:uncharacterized protein TNCV_1275791 [Trichonephila clavipes]|nr:uncharacterized protein TNCV_1275791 [Trichonephila clavipes]
MILTCEQESSWEDVWKGKIRYEFRNIGRAKKCVKIKSAFHLVRTMMYVSHSKPLCEKDEILDNLMDPVYLSHFHINRSLHSHSIASLLFPGGIEKLLLEQLGNKNESSWEKVKFKASTHLMILIPAKMNFPDYDDYIDMFSVPTPVSPLPPTPVASPSHELSQDVIYDSLPPMEQSKVPESPLKGLLPESPLKDLLPESPLKDLLPESPLKDLLPVDSTVVSKPPEFSTLPPFKKVASVIHRERSP